MKKLISLVLLTIFISSIGCGNKQGLTKNWMPKWEVGDRWIVSKYGNSINITGISKWKGPFRYEYIIKDIVIVNDIKCFKLEMQLVDNIDRRNPEILYYSQDYLKFIRLETYIGSLGRYTTCDFYIKDEEYPSINIPNYNSDFIMPLFPLNKREVKYGFNKPSTYGKYDEFIKIYSQKEYNDLLINNIPKPYYINSKQIDLEKYIFDGNKIITKLSDSCYYVEIKTKDNRNIYIKQLWNSKYPWAIYTESAESRCYLEKYYKNEMKK